MMIEDNELRDLFKMECEEHLQNLEEGLLFLEKSPDDQARLKDVFREAHSLKGASRMLGVLDVETLSHRFEDLLGQAKHGKIKLTSPIVDRLCRGLDDIRKLVNEAVTGNPANVDIDQALALLKGNPPQPAKSSTPVVPEPEPAPVPAAAEPIAEIQTEPAEYPPEIELADEQPAAELPEVDAVDTPTRNPESRSGIKTDAPKKATGVSETESYRIETIRVKPEKLDGLMTLAGELTVTNLRFIRRLGQIEEIMSLWEDFNRDVAQLESYLSVESVGINGKLHDTVLSHQERLATLLGQLKIESSEDSARLDFIATNIEEGIRTARLLPLSTIFNLFPRMVRDLAQQQQKQINLILEGGETTADKRILEEMKDPLMHIIRNAIDHGIEPSSQRQVSGKPLVATIHIRAYQTATNVVIEIEDDGQGLDIEAIKSKAIARKVCRAEEINEMTDSQIFMLIFNSGFSTSAIVTDVSGRGVGLDVVRTNVERLKGTIRVDSKLSQGCTFRIHLPVTLATTRVLIAAVDGWKYAIPVEFVNTLLKISQTDVFSIEGRETIVMDKHPTSIARLSTLLELDMDGSNGNGNGSASTRNEHPCIILQVGDDRLGVLVDDLVDEQEIVLKPHSGLLTRIRNVSGAAILGTGEVCTVLNPVDLIRSVQKRSVPVSVDDQKTGLDKKQVLLLVEDSITTRTQEKRILEGSSYEVVTAVDGVDGFTKLTSQSFDAVISDIEMPNMDGLALTEKIRQNTKYSDLPIILVTSLASEDDKRRGVEAGANAYITKSGFDQQVLLDTLKRLI